MTMMRFRVAGHSMLPTLAPGQEVVATFTRRPEPGNLVVFPHPGRAETWLIKRLADETGWVVSDNPGHADSDSRTLGIVDPSAMGTVVDRLDPETFAEAAALLAAEDEGLAGVLERWGLPVFWQRSPGFSTLTLLILEQQVSLESGAAMFRRLAALVGDVTPGAVLAAGDHGLRGIGVTRQKAGYLLDLAAGLVSGSVDLEELEHAPTEEARSALLALRGVGGWTADAYLLSAQRRPDMWPVGDRALQVGAADILATGSTPDPEELELIGEPWRPVRAVAARLIWHDYLCRRGRVEPADPTAVHRPLRDA